MFLHDQGIFVLFDPVYIQMKMKRFGKKVWCGRCAGEKLQGSGTDWEIIWERFSDLNKPNAVVP